MCKVTLCGLGLHRYHGTCTCIDCGHVRKGNFHSYYREPAEGEKFKQLCLCIHGCGHNRGSGHNWNGFKCETCKEVKAHECDWTKTCQCSICDKPAPKDHPNHLYGLFCRCTVCNQAAPPDHPNHVRGSDKENKNCHCDHCSTIWPDGKHAPKEDDHCMYCGALCIDESLLT